MCFFFNVSFFPMSNWGVIHSKLNNVSILESVWKLLCDKYNHIFY